MGAPFVFIDMSLIPPPDAVETLSFEALRTAILNDGVARMNGAGIAYNTQALESEPFVYLCEAYAARELNLRARVNDAIKAVLLASSWGTNLDNIGAAFETPRNASEADGPYAQRLHIAPSAFSSAGPNDAYKYWANTLVPGLLDVSAVMVSPGVVQVTLLAAPPQAYQVPIPTALQPWTVPPGPSFQPTAQQVQALASFFTQPNAKPLTDVVAVAGPKLVPSSISAVLTLYPGPDSSVVLGAANAALAAM